MLGWDSMIRFTFMCNETVLWNVNINLGTSGNGNTPLGLTLNYDHHSTSISTLWSGLAEYICTHPLLTHRLWHRGGPRLQRGSLLRGLEVAQGSIHRMATSKLGLSSVLKFAYGLGYHFLRYHRARGHHDVIKRSFAAVVLRQPCNFPQLAL